MTPTRPYLIRAFYDWIVDNGLTPYLLVDATQPGVQVPAAYVKDGRIVLNLAPAAVGELALGLEAVTFSARFAGVPHRLHLPVGAVMAVYARENGEGMFFGAEEDAAGDEAGAGDGDSRGSEPPRPGGRPSLKVVK